MSDEFDRDRGFIASIATDVIRALTASEFFEALDDVFSPKDNSRATVVCDGNYRIAKEILLARGFVESDFADVFAVLKERGACCDCEILYNAVESSRLKAEYWRTRARREHPKSPHHGSDSE
jgi:hypothetical protein